MRFRFTILAVVITLFDLPLSFHPAAIGAGS